MVSITFYNQFNDIRPDDYEKSMITILFTESNIKFRNYQHWFF